MPQFVFRADKPGEQPLRRLAAHVRMLAAHDGHDAISVGGQPAGSPRQRHRAYEVSAIAARTDSTVCRGQGRLRHQHGEAARLHISEQGDEVAQAPVSGRCRPIKSASTDTLVLSRRRRSGALSGRFD
jgi:hypothetical protein